MPLFQFKARHAIMAGLLTFALALVAAQSLNASAPHAVLNAQASMVSIHAITPKGKLVRGCSGGIVEGVIITAAHCVTDAPGQLVVRTLDGELWPAHATLVLPDRDQAILASAATRFYPSLDVGGALTLGDALYSFSFPMNFDVLMLQGVYSGVLAGPNVPYPARYMTLNSMSGASGSVVLNERGEAVGVISAVFRNNFAGVRLTGTIFVDLPVQP